MAYLNPFTVLGVSPDQELTTSDIRRLQKKVLAEFELTGEVVVDMNWVQVDKSQALGLVDELKNESRRRFHARVAAHPEWVQWLGSGEKKLADLPEWGALEGELREELGEKMVGPMGTWLKERLQAQDYEAARGMLVNVRDLRPGLQEKVLVSVVRRLEEVEKQVAGWTANIKKLFFQETPIREVLDPQWLRFLNALPPRYQRRRTQLAASLGDFAKLVFNQRHRYRLAYDIVESALTLAIDHGQRHRLETLFGQLVPFRNHPDAYPNSQEKDKRGFQAFSFLIGIFLLCGLIFTAVYFVFLRDSSTQDLELSHSGPFRSPNNSVFALRQDRLFSAINEFRSDSIQSEAPPWIPYRDFYPHQSIFPQDSVTIFINASPHAVVIFREEFESPWSHYCVAARDTTRLKPTIYAHRYLLYTGENWLEKVLTLPKGQGETQLGAFGKPLSRMPGEGGDPNLPLLSFDFPTLKKGESVADTLRFDGKELF